MTFSFQLSGSAGGSGETVIAGFDFGSATQLLAPTTSGGFGSSVGANLTTTHFEASQSGISPGSPFQTYTVGFTAGSAGSLKVYVGTTGNDNVGPILDNTNLSIASPSGAVPEPASWAMMLIGFGGLGATLRCARRRAVAI